MSLIEFDQVTKSYGGRPALAELTCTLKGRAVGLVGPNGAGKTTFMKLCLGLISPNSGRVEVLGQTITPKAANRVRFGFAAEGAGHLPHLSGLECVAYAGQLCGMAKRESLLRAHDMLDLVGLDEARYRPAEEYSTGMLQRTKVAMALVHDPDLVFLDEPTSGLDPSSRNEFLELLCHLRDGDGPAIILSTHILHDVEKACDEALILTDGRLRYCGSLDEMRSISSQEFRVRLLHENSTFVEDSHQFGLTATHLKRGAYQVHLESGTQTDAIWRLASHSRAVVIELEPEESGFEAAFLEQISNTEVLNEKQ